MGTHGTREEKISNALTQQEQLITEIYPGKNGATHINMNSVLTVLLALKNVLKLFLNI